MGDDRTGTITTLTGVAVAALIIALNAFLLYTTFRGG
jgi:Mn2+/Fe2+ NRAMP family transporter